MILWGDCCIGIDRTAVLSVVLFIHDDSKSSEMRHIESAILQEMVLITSVFGAKRGIVNWLHAACGICKSWQIAFKTLLKNKLTTYIASSPTTAGHTGFHKWNGRRSFTFLWIFQEGQNLISTCEGWGEGSQWRTDIKRISKFNPPFMSLYVRLMLTWWGFLMTLMIVE